MTDIHTEFHYHFSIESEDCLCFSAVQVKGKQNTDTHRSERISYMYPKPFWRKNTFECTNFVNYLLWHDLILHRNAFYLSLTRTLHPLFSFWNIDRLLFNASFTQHTSDIPLSCDGRRHAQRTHTRAVERPYQSQASQWKWHAGIVSWYRFV